MVDAVNSKLPSDGQFSLIGWGPVKTLRLHKQYRRLYPNGDLLRRQGIWTAAMFSCFVVAAGLIGLGIFIIAWLSVGSALLVWVEYFR